MLIEKNQENLENNKGCFKHFWGLFAFGWLLILLLCYDVYQSKVTQNWTPVEAKLENVELKINASFNSDENFYLVLDYEYELDGVTYKGDRLAKKNFLRNQIKNLRWNLNPIYKKLNHAKKVQIYVNPKNPNDSVLINQLTNSWYSFLWFTLFVNVFLYGVKFETERKNKFFLLLPLVVLILMIYQSVAEIQYVDTLGAITVTEEYSPTDCKFIEASFRENVYIWINNYRMTKNHIYFNRNSSIQEMNIVDKYNNSNPTFLSTAVVTYRNEGITRMIKYSLEYDIFDECSFKYKNIELID